ncbi:MAG: hypothetical protein GTO46_09675 [Gemmatimonadetes bacterium]|nr:hypothetical protein [Gemmatimonadota bacterium]NIO31882.1 hypothetical protein [Gemmatimonadota bacterium]
MRRNRVEGIRDKYDPAGEFCVEPKRRTALLAIEEVLGGREATTGTPTPELPASLPTPPQAVPRTGRAASPWVTRRRRRRRSRRAKRRPLIVAATLGLALCIGALVGSGAFNARDRYNAQLIAAQEGAAQVYELPEVQGHPGAAPSRERSGSIREFLGMASAF